MQIRVYSISKAFAGRCLVVAALLAAAVVTGCTLDERIPGDKQAGETIKIRVSGDASIGNFSTRSALPRQERYTVVGSVISGGDFEDETFEVIVMPNTVSPVPDALQSDTRASYGGVTTVNGQKIEKINWDAGDRISVFSDVATSKATKTNSGSLSPIAYCDFTVTADQNIGSQGVATPVNVDLFKDGLSWQKSKKHRFIGIWPQVDSIAFLTNSDALSSGQMEMMELTFTVQHPSVQTAQLDASNITMNVYNKGLGKVVMYSGATVTTDNSGSATLDLPFHPAFTTLELQLKGTAGSTMKLNKVTVSSQEDYLACKAGQGFTGIIKHGVNTSGNTETTFEIANASLTDTYCSKSIELTFLDANGVRTYPELATDKATKLCLMALPHQIGALTILLDLTVDGQHVERQLDLRVKENNVVKWIDIPSCSKVIISNLAIPATVDKGLVQKAFTVAPNKKVIFSPGNLRAQKIGNNYSWYFAPNQYSTVGENGSNNDQVSGSGEIDLFGWSGEQNANGTKWGILGSGRFYGQYLPCADALRTNLGNDQPYWNLLTKYEFEYLLTKRTNATEKVALATVGDTTGIVILPDTWTLPANCTFDYTATDYATNKYSILGTPGTSGSWTAMEQAGAVFFPNAGFISNNVYSASETYYQTSTNDDVARVRYRTSSYSWIWNPQSNPNVTFSTRPHTSGRPVRMTALESEKSWMFDYTGSGITSQKFSISANTSVQFTTSNLMWDGSKGYYRLMDDPWTTIETTGENPTVKSVGDQIGLFQWGASGWNHIWPWTIVSDRTTLGMIQYMNNPQKHWRIDRVTGNYWDWGDNVVYDASTPPVQINAERQQSTLRTLNDQEWSYLLFKRPQSNRYTPAKVNGVCGLLIFPDGVSAADLGLSLNGNQTNPVPIFMPNTFTSVLRYKNIDLSTWESLAQNGVVFLPAAGEFDTTDDTFISLGVIQGPGYNAPQCYYWTSSIDVLARTSEDLDKKAKCFSTSDVLDQDNNLTTSEWKNNRMAVRLVYQKSIDENLVSGTTPFY